MDVNATLARIRVLTGWFLDSDHERSGDFISNALELAELNAALDEWLSRGGFVPDAWKR